MDKIFHNISEKSSKERIYRSISMKRKTCRSLWSHGQSMMILRKKKKKKNVQEEPIKLSKTNNHSLTPFVSPLGNPEFFYYRDTFSSPTGRKFHPVSRDHERVSLYPISIPKLNHSIDPIAVISLEVPPLVPLPPSSTGPSNDCKDPGPSAEGRADSSARWPS